MLKHVGCIAFLGSTPYFFGDFMDKNIFTIDSDCSGMTVKEYILGYLGYSVGVLKKLKYSGKITVITCFPAVKYSSLPIRKKIPIPLNLYIIRLIFCMRMKTILR